MKQCRECIHKNVCYILKAKAIPKEPCIYQSNNAAIYDEIYTIGYEDAVADMRNIIMEQQGKKHNKYRKKYNTDLSHCFKDKNMYYILQAWKNWRSK